MSYIPSFKCPHCGEVRQAQIFGPGEGLFVMCDCKESRDEWERKHRIEMERRKNAERGGRR
jgi:hypothetical protein